MRYRSRNSDLVFQSPRITSDKYGNVLSTGMQSIQPTDRDEIWDEVVPQFKSRSKTGGIFINPLIQVKTTNVQVQKPYTSRVMTRSATTAPWELTESSYFSKGDVVGFSVNLPRPWEHSSVVAAMGETEALSLTAAFAEVGKADVESMVSLAELKETLGFLATPVNTVKALTKKMERHLKVIGRIDALHGSRVARYDALPDRVKKRRKPPSPPTYPTMKLGRFTGDDVTSSWLAYRYAIMPLMYEIDDWVSFFAKKADLSVKRITTRANSSKHVDLTWDTGEATVGTPRRFRHTLSAEIRSRAGVLYAPRPPTLANQLGVEWHRLLPTAYELIPLSFVADWFWNGAQYYDALTAQFRALEFLGAWNTTTIQGTYSCNVDRNADYTSGDSRVTVTPSGNTGGSMVLFEVKYRGSRTLSNIGVYTTVNLNAKRIADGLALISSFIRGRAK